MCILRSSPNGVSVMTRLTITFAWAGASAPCSSTSFPITSNQSSDRNSCFAVDCSATDPPHALPEPARDRNAA
jgi:hypothetical protein